MTRASPLLLRNAPASAGRLFSFLEIKNGTSK